MRDSKNSSFGRQAAISDDEPNYPVRKSGFFIFGDVVKNGRADRYVIAPYSEGRFDHSRRHFSLAKGSVDQIYGSLYEDPWDAAIRETKEEAGIDIVKLVGEENLRKLRNPETAQHVKFPLTSPEYPGVIIKRVFAQPIADQMCVNRDGTGDLRTQMFGIELAENQITSAPIRKALKNTLDVHQYAIDHPWKDHRNGDVREPVWQILEDHDAYPNRNDLIDWLMQGRMPEKPWNKTMLEEFAKGERDAVLSESDIVLPGNEDGAWFRGVLKRELGYVPGEEGHPPLERTTWHELYHGLPKDDQAKIKELAEHVKGVLKKVVPLMRDDNAVFKMDTSDIPFNIYQEGADVMPLSEYVAHSFKEGKDNEEYSRTFLGRIREEDALGVGLTQSQLGMVAAIMTDRDIESCRMHSSSTIGLLQAQRLKYAEQQEKYFGAPIDPDSVAALARSRTRTLATINDETTHGRRKARTMREHATREPVGNEASLG